MPGCEGSERGGEHGVCAGGCGFRRPGGAGLPGDGGQARAGGESAAGGDAGAIAGFGEDSGAGARPSAGQGGGQDLTEGAGEEGLLDLEAARAPRRPARHCQQ